MYAEAFEEKRQKMNLNVISFVHEERHEYRKGSL